MKSFLKRSLSAFLQKLIIYIDHIIELRLFRPLALSIVTIFVIFQGFILIKGIIDDNQLLATNSANDLKKYKIIADDSSSGSFDLSQNQVMRYIVKPGDTILKILIDIGAAESRIFSLLSAMKKVYSPRSIVEGNEITIDYSLNVNYDSKNSSKVERQATINSLTIKLSSDEKVIVQRDGDNFIAKKHKIDLVRSIERYYGEIKSGLYLDGVALGLSSNVMMNLINLYSYDIDFQRDIRSGDKFEVVVEGFYTKDGQKVRDGNILYASISVRNKPIAMYMHKYRNRIEYFNKKGNSVKKSLLRTPVNGARISSRFGMRKHPILGYSRMHKGIDFAAPRGTPILAAGDGKIVSRGRNGGYGNYIRIKHNSQYSTAYAHASRFNRRFKRGSRVKQGDVIAYVGTTGRSTGPHLHFEVMRNGRHINPSKVKASSGIRLKGANYREFAKARDIIESYRKNIPNQIHLQK